MSLAPGSIIAGRYRVERELGEGGMGVVVVATQLSLGRLVALKVMKRRDEEGAVERFQREVDVIARLQHPNIVSVIDGGSADDDLFLAMELLSGETLRARVKSGGPLSAMDALAVAEDLAAALAAAHAAGVIHRDVKAENVMLVPVIGGRARAKLLDFGIAKARSSSSITSPHAVPGTPGCIAPEQLTGVDDEPRSDLYSLGVLLFEALTGERPFEASSLGALIAAHMTQLPPRVDAVCARRGLPDPGALADVVARLLEKDPARRPTAAALVDDLRALRESALPTSTGTQRVVADSPASDLVGRAAELAILRGALVDAEAGRGSLVVLVGEPGIGKTRVAEAVAVEAAGRFDVAWGRAWEAGGAPPLVPWSEALRALADARGMPLGAVLEEALAGGGGGAGAEPSGAPFRVFQAVDAFLDKAVRARPALIVLEDLHAADLLSFKLLEAVVRRIRGKRLLVLATARDVDTGADREVGALISSLARAGRTVTLQPLNSAEVAALVRLSSRTPGAPATVSDEVAAAIVDATHGNPLFASELAELLRAQGRLAHAPRGALPIPLGVRDALRQRLERLPAPTREVLEVAATIGRRAGTALLSRVLGRSVDDEVHEALHEAVRARVVTLERGVATFHHALFVEAIVADLAPARRRSLSAAVADALAQAGAPAAEIAHHLFEAGSARATDAVDAALRAADAALGRAAFDDAAHVLERAAEILDAGDQRRRARVFVTRGRALLLAGDEDRARPFFVDAAAIARSLGDATLLAEAALGYGARIRDGEVLPFLVKMLEEALAALGTDDNSPLRPRVLARLAAARQPAFDPYEPLMLADQAVQLARKNPLDRVTLLHTLHDAVGAMVDYAPPRVREPLTAEALALAEELGDDVRAERARLRLFWDALELGRLDDAERIVEAYARQAEVTREPSWRLPQARLFMAVARGDRSGAATFVPAVRDAAKNNLVAQLMPLVIDMSFGRGDDLRRELAALLARVPSSLHGFVHAFAAPLVREPAASAHFVANDQAALDPYLSLNGMPLYIEANARARLAQVFARHITQAERILTFSGYTPGAVPLSQCAAALGDHAQADALMEIALRLGRSSHMPITLFRSTLAAAAHFAANDPERARTLLDEAAAIDARLSLPMWRGEIERVAGTIAAAR